MSSVAGKQLGLVFFPAFDWAISPTHPEREERLLFTRDQVLEEGLLDLPQIREYKPRLASITDLERVHIGVPDIASLITDAHRRNQCCAAKQRERLLWCVRQGTMRCGWCTELGGFAP